MKEAFIVKNFRDASLAMIATCNEILDTYMGQGFSLTLRQLYYQLVSRNIIPNQENRYKALGNLMKDARMAGLVDWDAIEDRGRRPNIPTEFNGLTDLVQAALDSYRLPRWEGQPYYIELWVEKDALSGVLAPLGDEYHVTIVVDRGYSSASGLYDAAQRRFANHTGQECVLIYLGDHDPSGLDMDRDITERGNILPRSDPVIRIKRIALTWGQIQSYQLPPNPAKKSDSRYKAYIAKYGYDCWEVDAIPPAVLQTLVRDAIENHLDKALMDGVKAREDSDKARLRNFIRGLDLQ
jgi:hypothetical protein